MPNFNRINSEQRANLVAYLDGELDESHSGEVEQLLSHSEVARHDVEMLSRTFDMLDLLPKEKAEEDFTQRTLTVIKTTEQVKPLTEQSWFIWGRRTILGLFWGIGLVAALFVGFHATYRWWPNDSQVLIDDLDFLENLHLYEEIESEDTLKQLRTKGFLRHLEAIQAGEPFEELDEEKPESEEKTESEEKPESEEGSDEG